MEFFFLFFSFQLLPTVVNADGSWVRGATALRASARPEFNSAASTASRSSAELLRRWWTTRCARPATDRVRRRSSRATPTPSARSTTSKSGDPYVNRVHPSHTIFYSISIDYSNYY